MREPAASLYAAMRAEDAHLESPRNEGRDQGDQGVQEGPMCDGSDKSDNEYTTSEPGRRLLVVDKSPSLRQSCVKQCRRL